MASIEERLQIKREPLDKWSIREQLCLAIARNSDQNLTSVSRALKPFGEPNRPPDWFHQKNCAAQYGALLANVETPKRKKRTAGGEVTIETPSEAILRKLLAERKAELKRLLGEEKAEYLKIQKDKALLQSGNVSEEQLDIWCKEIDEEERRKEQETTAHEQWLRERELRKQEIERAWRPNKPATPVPGQKRKHSDSMEGLMENETVEEQKLSVHEPPRPALSPLLTSLLKSPSQVPNVAATSILHSAITNQRPTNTSTTTSPMIASLLNSSTGVTVSPGLQQLVSSAIGQEPTSEEVEVSQQSIPTNDILDDPSLQILKIDDLASSILIQNGPLPEMKNDVDVIISDLIENAHDIVADPEQHLQLDGNGDLNLNLELEDFEDNETDVKEETRDSEKPPEKPTPTVDPFEFQEDPEIFEPSKPSGSNKSIESCKTITNLFNEDQQQPREVSCSENKDVNCINLPAELQPEEIKKEPVEDFIKKEKTPVPGSVEIVEVVVMEEEDIDKELNKSQIEDIVHSVKVEAKEEKEPPKEDTIEIKEELDSKEIIITPKSSEVIPEAEKAVEEVDKKEPPESNLDVSAPIETSTVAPVFNEELYDDINMEVKVDKTGKAKRDYSRTKKKDEKEFDVLLAIEKVQRDESESVEESFSDYSELERKDAKSRIKSENERSNSPWTEEEDTSNIRLRRRISTPATPIDSVPNSPVSSIFYYDDDREYRNWKKSVMLVYSRLAANKYASLFSKPITDDQAPGYHSVVHRPMDLLTIRKNIESGAIRTTQELQRDVLLMFNNAIMYNKTNDTVYNMARQMQQESLQQIQILLQAQSQVDVPVRRETRTSEPGCKRKRVSEDLVRSKKRKED